MYIYIYIYTPRFIYTPISISIEFPYSHVVGFIFDSLIVYLMLYFLLIIVLTRSDCLGL